MSDFTNKVISLYTEQTPNPENRKFVVNSMLYSGNSIDFPNADTVEGRSPLADSLFAFPYIKSVFISHNFVTIGKVLDADWMEITPEIKSHLYKYLSDEQTILDQDAIDNHTSQEQEGATEETEGEVVGQIKELLKKYVQPHVAQDGGAIVFKSYDDGIVTLGMQGACSGCPSSTITLKAGIEGMMKRMIPEVKEVVAEAM